VNASRDQIPVLNDMQGSFGRPGLTVIGLSLADTVEQVKQFQLTVSQKYQVGLLSTGSTRSPTNLPTTYIIDRHGRVRSKLLEPEQDNPCVRD